MTPPFIHRRTLALLLAAGFFTGAIFLAGLRVLRVAIVHNLRSVSTNRFACINR